MSYNQEELRNKDLHRLFIPSLLGGFLECLVASLLLVIINFAALEGYLLQRYPKDLTFTSYSSELLNNFLANLSHFYLSGQLIIFVAWAMVGMVGYIIIMRLFRAISGLSTSVHRGVSYIKVDHSHGLVRWLGSLHNFFLKLLIFCIGTVLFVSAIFLIYVYAAHQVQVGFIKTWPLNILPFGLSLLATIAGVRLVVIAACLTMPRFARWYVN
jgi:hypothetical protein